MGVWRKLTTPSTMTASVITRMRYLRLSEKAMMKSMNLFIAKRIKDQQCILAHHLLTSM